MEAGLASSVFKMGQSLFRDRWRCTHRSSVRLDLFLFLFGSHGLFLFLFGSHPHGPTGSVSGTDSEKSWSCSFESWGQLRVEQSNCSRIHSPNCSVDGTKGNTAVDDLNGNEEV